ncbi:MAG: 4Fe-4S dicluster domain-containing protein [Leptospira sp.]|nr:4Fe-4S dicluster domain-containing protein [Leptospira sp.]
MDRRNFLKKSFSKLIEGAINKTEEIYSAATEKIHEFEDKEEDDSFLSAPELTRSNRISKGLKFPPGALQPKEKFLKKCTGCGDCVQACTYNVLFPVFDSRSGKNIPSMDVNLKACMMCKDWPCINSCGDKALKPLKKKEIKFGQAKSLFDYCINSKSGEKTCSACEISCPVDSAISFRKNKPVFHQTCTGCGQCVQTCPTFPKAIIVK